MIVLSVLALSACATTSEKQSEAKKQQLVTTLTALGAGYMERGQMDVAHHELKHALSIDPDNSQANNVMAVLQARLGESKKADAYFRKSISAQPDNSDAQNNYGMFLCQQGRLNDAIEHFKSALANPLYSTPGRANLNAGLCLMKMPEPERAEKYFRATLESDPKQPVALYFMSKINFDQGRPLTARGYIQRYFRVAKDSPMALLLAVQIERALGARNAAASYAFRLRSLFPSSPEAKQLRALAGT